MISVGVIAPFLVIGGPLFPVIALLTSGPRFRVGSLTSATSGPASIPAPCAGSGSTAHNTCCVGASRSNGSGLWSPVRRSGRCRNTSLMVTHSLTLRELSSINLHGWLALR